MIIETVFDSSFEHGEGPIWDVQSQSLYWVDLFAGDFFKGDPVTGNFAKRNIGQPIGVVALRESGGVVFAAHEGFGFTEVEGDSPVTFFNNPQPNFPETRFNDGKIDPLGNFVAGTMTFDGMKPIGNLFRLQPDKMVKCLESNLLLSNGIDWSPDGTKCYLADTYRQFIYRYDFNLNDGTITNRQHFIDFNEYEYPDGFCIDKSGNLWVAMWGSGQIIQFDTEGKRRNVIELPVTHPTSCCFGGNNLSTLYITTSTIGLTDIEKRRQPLAGKILKVEMNYQGQEMRKYKG